MAHDYVPRQIERYRTALENLQARHGMTHQQFEACLKARSALLATSPSPALSHAVMAEEEDALDWRIAHEMLQSCLGLEAESGEEEFNGTSCSRQDAGPAGGRQ